MRRGWAPSAVAVFLCGCVSLLPKAPPAQLYRFGANALPLAGPSSPRPAQFAVKTLPLSFDRAAAGDQILTIAGDQAAYIKGARWLVGASTLFEQALSRAFAADHGPARLAATGENVRPDYLLKLSVRSFETRYVDGTSAPPTVVVEFDAALSRPGDRSLVGERRFSAASRASENRVGAIVSAYNAAVATTLSALVRWVDGRAAA